MIIDLTTELQGAKINLHDLSSIILAQSKSKEDKPKGIQRFYVKVQDNSIGLYINEDLKLGHFERTPEMSVTKADIVEVLKRYYRAMRDLIDPRRDMAYAGLVWVLRQVLPAARQSHKYYNTLVHPSVQHHMAIVLQLGAEDNLSYTDCTFKRFETQVDALFCPTISNQLKIYIRQLIEVIQVVVKPDTPIKISTAIIDLGDGQGFDFHIKTSFMDNGGNERYYGVHLDSTVIDFNTGTIRDSAKKIIQSIEV